MNQKLDFLKFLIITIVLLVIVASGWGLLSLQSQNRQLSVKPELAYSNLTLEPIQSNIGLHTRLPYRSLISAAEQVTEETQYGSGEKQSCKRVLGAKVCATLQWQYSIRRDGDIEIEPKDDRLQLRLPISFAGVVSVDGRGGKLLGLRNKEIDGKLELIADLDFAIGKDWCPKLDSDVNYRWRSDPKITLIGSIRINLRKSVDKALQRKLRDLKTRLNDVIDCTEFRKIVQRQWHTHSLDIDLNANSTSQLLVTPVAASVSKVGMLKDHVSVAFDLNAIVKMRQPDLTIATDPLQKAQTQSDFNLPDLIPHTRTPGTVEFSLLMEVPYPLLRERLAGKTVGETYASGDSHSLTVTSLDLYPAEQLLIIDVGFRADAFGSLFNTTGNVYISARPVADPANNQLILEELQLTRSIDSKLMTAVTTVLRHQLISALQEASVIDLQPSMAKIESSIEAALSNPEKTAGIEVNVESPEVRLMALNPQANGLAAIVHLSTRLQAKVPEDVLIR